MELKRKIYDRLLEWKTKDHGESALLIEGARRVGKSYIAEKFARQEYDSYLLIDFSKAPAEIKELFEIESEDLDTLFQTLQAHYKARLKHRRSCIIFDEIQFCPKARQMIKSLVADGRYDYIETGSLISLRQNISDILIPSEEECIRMYPLDFEEFLWAIGDETTYSLIRERFRDKKPLGQALHRSTMKAFRQYILVGGMPQVVTEYAKERDFEAADRIKKRILRLYREDISKFAKGYESKVYAIFDDIPGQLSKKKRNTSLPLLENPPDEENMKMHLSGLMRLWLSIRALMPPTLPWDLSCQRNLPHRRSIWQTPDCSSHLPSATATIWIMTSTGTFSLIS